MSSPAVILLLADDDPRHAAVVLDHIGAFRRWSRHEVHVFNPSGSRGGRLLDLAEFDAVVLHFSLIQLSDYYLPAPVREKVARFRGLKLHFVQDDYRGIDALAAEVRRLGVHVLFSALPEAARRVVWSDARLPGVRKEATLTGYVPEGLVGRLVPPVHERPVAVGYRARAFPPWMGRVAQERVAIGREFLRRAAPLGLTCDIRWDEASRIYGEGWVRFHARCRSVLGTESAVSIVDFDGAAERASRGYLAAHPGAPDDELEREVLAAWEGNVVVRVISARVFEAAALRTPMVLFRGDYSGVLHADRHYVPLDRDFSNFDEVARRLADHRELQRMADTAYDEIAASGRYSYREMVRRFDDVVDALIAAGPPRAKVRLGLARLAASEPSRALGATARSVRAQAARAREGLLLAVIGLRLTFADPRLRRLWRLGLLGPAAARPGRIRLAADLLRLALLAHRPPGSFAVSLAWDQRRSAVTLASRPVDAARPPESQGASGCPVPLEIVWDHRRVGRQLTLGRDNVRLGENGVYPFEALARLASVAPAQVWEALRAAADRF